MRERPIPFSAGMVRAILRNQKTQTRRLLKPQPQPNGGKGFHPVAPYHRPDGQWTWVLAATGVGGDHVFRCPYGVPGDRLWVREAWRAIPMYDHLKPSEMPNHDVIDWEANEGGAGKGRYRHARFMPRWASRIDLEVVAVRVERLKDISLADVIAEGIGDDIEDPDTIAGNAFGYAEHMQIAGGSLGHSAEVHAFSAVWESINGSGSWDANPWLWVIEFKRIED